MESQVWVGNIPGCFTEAQVISELHDFGIFPVEAKIRFRDPSQDCTVHTSSYYSFTEESSHRCTIVMASAETKCYVAEGLIKCTTVLHNASYYIV